MKNKMKKKTDITKISRVVGILSVILLFAAAYLPWAYIYKNGTPEATLTGMDTVSSSYDPALVALIFAVLYLITIFIHKLWLKIAGVFFAVVVIAWCVYCYNSVANHATQLYDPERFTQYTSDTAKGLYVFILGAIGVLFASLTPYFPDKYRKDRD